jgi:hypothetical protein
MNRLFVVIAGLATIGMLALSSPVYAQQKTVKACQDEWRANKAANQAAKITLKAYVDKCRTGSAPAAAAPAKPAKPAARAAAAPGNAQQKTVKACQDEWRANKDANQAAKITLKAYVEKCRAGSAPPAAATAKPAKPAAPAAAAPKLAPAVATAPTGARQYATETQAKARCPSDTVVWVNLSSKIYHFAGYADYGHTKSGAYMCEKDTAAAGARAAKNEKHP